MDSSFHIFVLEKEGHIHWLGRTNSLEDAKRRVGELGSTVPGEYLICAHPSGKRTTGRQLARM
jgi:hypothetical protein